MGDEQDICAAEHLDLVTRVAIVLDPMLVDVWASVWPQNENGDFRNGVSLDELGGLLRLAYLRGYLDAREEPVKGELLARLGVRAEPGVKKRRRSARRPR